MFFAYYRRCPYYGSYLLPSASWDNSRNRGFTTTETTGLKIDPEILAFNFEGFLDCIGSYATFDYVGEKLRAESTSISTVWEILYELYNAEIPATNYFDYAIMRREPTEFYCSYFNRLVGFVRQHLPSKSYDAESVISPTAFLSQFLSSQKAG